MSKVKTFWDGRENINNRPSLSRRTILVIEHIMNEHDVAMGVALEMLIQDTTLWDTSLKFLKGNGYGEV